MSEKDGEITESVDSATGDQGRCSRGKKMLSSCLVFTEDRTIDNGLKLQPDVKKE